MSSNIRLYHPEPLSKSVIQSTKIPTLGPDEILVHPYAWALNPVDVILQEVHLPFVHYPLVPGHDLAGVVVCVGRGVTDYKPGDRVMGLALGSTNGKNDQGGFQRYSVLQKDHVAMLPDAWTFAQGSVVPLTLVTAACALFDKRLLSLPWPTKQPATGTLLVWGASSSVGCNTIQLAKLAGYEIIATCSKRNFKYIQALGAREVFDYADIDIVETLSEVIDKSICVGIVVAMGDVAQACRVSHRSSQKLFVATATGPWKDEDIPEGVQVQWTVPPPGDEDAAEEFHQRIIPRAFEFVQSAMAGGAFVAAPEPHIIAQKGLAGIEDGYKEYRKGVSAQKIVIENDEGSEHDQLQ